MYIEDFLPEKSEVLTKAMALPRVKPNSDEQVLMRAVGDTVSTLARGSIYEKFHLELSDAVAFFEINNGEYDDLPEGDEGERARDDYSSAIDDVVENVVDPYSEYLSADWLGRMTIETRLWEKGAKEKLAESFAKELWKQLTHDRSPAQVLANAGITAGDVRAAHTNPKEETTMADTNIETVIAKIKNHVGPGADVMAIYEDLETICEEDDAILVGSAAERLGCNDADVLAIQMQTMELDDVPSELSTRIDEYKAPSKAAKAKADKAAKAAAKEAGEDGALPAVVFENMKACGVGDTAMAEELGVSRSTYVNYVKGKTHLTPEPEQLATIRSEVVNRANMMLEALAAIDGTEAQVVS